MQLGQIPQVSILSWWNEAFRRAETDGYMKYACLSHNHSPRRNWAFHKDLSDASKQVNEFGKVAGNHDNRESFFSRGNSRLWLPVFS